MLAAGAETFGSPQSWLQKHAIKQPSISEMAAIAAIGERTFLRRFQKTTGLKPTEYCQRLRVGKAREMLEFTSETVDHIARTIGYEDLGSFRKVFQRVTGLPPRDYRRRFSVKPHDAHAEADSR
jgi:transcriptional regulator GlxA family with amidase domain